MNQTATGRKRGASGIIVASIVAAGASFLITMLANWALVGSGDDYTDYTEFIAFWALLFGIFGVIAGLQNETTRAVGAARLAGAQAGTDGAARPPGASVLASGLLIGAVTAVLIVASSPLWAGQLVPSNKIVIVGLIALATVLYSGHISLSGALAGNERWGLFAGLMGAEAGLRLVLVAVISFAVGSLFSLEVATMAAVLVWLGFLLVSASSRDAIRARADVPMGRLVTNQSMAIASAAATAVLITGFPAVMRMIIPHDPQDAAMSATATALMLTRSPIMIPLQAFQGVAIASFLKQGHGALKGLVKPLGTLLAVGLVGAPLAALVGPWFLRVAFSGMQVAALTFAGLMLASVAIAWLTLTGTATLAIGRHPAYLLGWVSAAVVAVALLLVPISIPGRTILALAVGPLVGVAIHLIVIARHARAAGAVVAQPMP